MFKKIVLHFKERLGDLCTIKVAPTRKFVGHPLRGVEVHINTDDTELIKERIDGMFDGRCIDYRKK